MSVDKKKKIATLLTIFGTIIMVGVFVAFFSVMFTLENIDLTLVLVLIL